MQNILSEYELIINLFQDVLLTIKNIFLQFSITKSALCLYSR